MGIHWCTWVYTGIHWCTLWYTWAYICRLAPRGRALPAARGSGFTNVHQCTPTYTNVHQCTPMYTNVHQCTLMYTNVPRASRSRTNRRPIAARGGGYTNAHQCTPTYTNVHQRTPTYASVHQCPPTVTACTGTEASLHRRCCGALPVCVCLVRVYADLARPTTQSTQVAPHISEL